MTRRRTTRSRAVEIGVAILAIWLFLQVGGPAAVGQWLGPMFAPW